MLFLQLLWKRGRILQEIKTEIKNSTFNAQNCIILYVLLIIYYKQLVHNRVFKQD